MDPLRFTSATTTSVEHRFWSHVQKTDDCWIWTASRVGGYGRMWLAENVRILAHRLSWLIHNGTIPVGKRVLHKCDNPPCVRPDHLFLGTMKDNIQDALRKKRMAFGERVGSARLADSDVVEIHRLHRDGKSGYAIAKHFSIDRGKIYKILKRKMWSHVVVTY